MFKTVEELKLEKKVLEAQLDGSSKEIIEKDILGKK